jgi:dTDP-glucose pyrophosphorylase
MQKGIIDIGSDNRVLKFYEKPIEAKSDWACPPVYFLQPSALKLVNEYVARPDAKDSPGNFVAYLVNHFKVYAIKVSGKRLDIGSMEAYEEANSILSIEPVILS